MEQFWEIVRPYLVIVLNYLPTVVAYFLVFLFKNGVSHTRDNLNIAMKEQLENISKTDANLREKFESGVLTAQRDYQAAIDKVNSFDERLARTEKMLSIFVEETEVEANESIPFARETDRD